VHEITDCLLLNSILPPRRLRERGSLRRSAMD
jgi:hypothetical protein